MNDQDRPACVHRYGPGHAAQQRGLHACEAACPQNDRGSVKLICDVADRSPRLAVHDTTLRRESGGMREHEATVYFILGDLVRDLV
ncbi:MAG TPA: hypothetical protein VFH80_12045 [Solirubrobacteraceae bacterium]|nr:hypothetical protein [Solirubrobacteraceae bacterium]